MFRVTNRLEEAEPLFREALAVRERIYEPEHPDVAQSLNNLASLFASADRMEKAEPLYRRALAIREKSLGPYHPKVATSLSNLASLLYNSSKFEEAEALYRRALEIILQFNRETGHQDPRFQTYLGNFELCLVALGRTPDEISASRESMELKPGD